MKSCLECCLDLDRAGLLLSLFLGQKTKEVNTSPVRAALAHHPCDANSVALILPLESELLEAGEPDPFPNLRADVSIKSPARPDDGRSGCAEHRPAVNRIPDIVFCDIAEHAAAQEQPYRDSPVVSVTDAGVSTQNLDSGVDFPRDQWVCLVADVQLNTSGNADGFIRLSMNGTPIITSNDRQFIAPGVDANMSFTRIYQERGLNGNIDVDDISIGDGLTAMNCGSPPVGTPPNAPTNLQVTPQ